MFFLAQGLSHPHKIIIKIKNIICRR